MPLVLKPFQETLCNGLLARYRNLAAIYRELELGKAQNKDIERKIVRERDAAVVLQAPTGAGKTSIAIETLARFSQEEPVLWFWFAPFSGLVDQARKAIRQQAPHLRLLDLSSDRRLDLAGESGIFVTTWAALATGNKAGRKARNTSDSGLAVDALMEMARDQGIRIGCVVDEAHHGFKRAKQAQAFFTEVLKPDYALLMTATPRDADIEPFQKATGYQLGESADWATVSRHDGVEAGLLKKGVRVVRFLAKDNDTRQLVNFEQLALQQCAETHRQIHSILADAGISLTPLMLVQVPDGKTAQEEARRYLIESLNFSEEAVRIHTSDEPDPDLLALANDPKVEVLIFKMAVALGFDAPRAYTLAALRGARDPSFGIQVIGRIVRVHRQLQGVTGLPESLSYGYVFLANAESQEGLLDAGAQINSLKTQAPEIGTATVVTYSGSAREVQVARSGEPFALTLGEDGKVTTSTDNSGNAPAETEAVYVQTGLDLGQAAMQQAALISGESDKPASPGPSLADFSLSLPDSGHQYPRRKDVPETLRGERLPGAPADMEMRLVDHVDFDQTVLASRDRIRTQVRRGEIDIFRPEEIREDGEDVWASLSVPAMAAKARQVVLRLHGINERAIRERLLVRFRQAIEKSGALPPEDEEILEQQLDRVLISHPSLLREAYRRARLEQVVDIDIVVPAVLQSDLRPETSERNVYGVFPAGMDEDERHIATLLDKDSRVLWWHRNADRHHRPDALGLYRWDEGSGFYPDFVVAIEGRKTPHNVALLEVKGAHLWGSEKEPDKADAVHSDYGRVYMVGRRKGTQDFKFLRNFEGRLQEESSFEISRLIWL